MPLPVRLGLPLSLLRIDTTMISLLQLRLCLLLRCTLSISSARVQCAAVRLNKGTTNVSSGSGGQEKDKAGYVLWLANAAHRMRGSKMCSVLREPVCGHLYVSGRKAKTSLVSKVEQAVRTEHIRTAGVHAWTDRIYGDVLLCQSRCKRLGQALRDFTVREHQSGPRCHNDVTRPTIAAAFVVLYDQSPVPTVPRAVSSVTESRPATDAMLMTRPGSCQISALVLAGSA